MIGSIIAAGLSVEVGVCFGKFLLKHYLGEFAESGIGGFLDFSKDYSKERIKNSTNARKAAIEYEKIGLDIVTRLETDLNEMLISEVEPRSDPNKILQRFKAILSGRLATTFVIRNQLVPHKLYQAIILERVPGIGTFTKNEEYIFGNCASRISQYLYRAASKLPIFDEMREEESLATLLQLSTEVSDVLDDTQAIREQVVTRPLSDEADYENSYRNAVVAELDKVELFGIDLPPELKRSKLTDAYVTLRLTPSDNIDIDDNDDIINEDNSNTVTAEVAFDRILPVNKRILIRGGAGCGKTTLIRWVAIQAARGTENKIITEFEYLANQEIRILQPEEQTHIAANWRRKMPFIIALRNCPDGKLPTPDLFPTQIGNEIGNPTPQWAQRLLHAGNGLILIDGIDEISKQNHLDLYNSIERLCSIYPDCYYIITTRPHAITDVRFEDLGFVAAEVEALDDKDRDLFIKHWFIAIARKLKLSMSEVNALDQESAILAKIIAKTPWLAQLVTTPLYCAMTCALYRHSNGTLPQSLRAMCETLCKMMVDSRDRQRKLPVDTLSATYGTFSYEQKKLILRKLACYFVLAERSSIPVPDAVEQVRKVLSGMLHRSENDAGQIFESLLVRSGLIRLAAESTEDKPALLEFVHNTFKEFLAGEQLAEEANASFLIRRLVDENWRRVGLFAISAGSAKYQNEIMKSLLDDIPSPLTKDKKKKTMSDVQMANTPRGKALFAYRCGFNGNEWSPDVKERLSKMTKELFPPKSLTEAEWLASAGNDVVPLLSVKTHSNGFIVAACIRALRLIGTTEAYQALEQYKSDDRHNVLRELIRVFDISELKGIQNVFLREHYLPPEVAAKFSDLSIIQHLTNIFSLSLDNSGINDISKINSFKRLYNLNLNNTRVTNISPLIGLKQLRNLYLGNTHVTDISSLQHLVMLKNLSLTSLTIVDFSPLALLSELTSLYLSATNIVDLTPLSKLSKLQLLSIWKTNIIDLSPLSALGELKELDISFTNCIDLSPLSNLTKLKQLDIQGISKIDLSPIQHLIDAGTKIVGR